MGVFLSLLAVIFYLALAIFYVIDPIRLVRTRRRRQATMKAGLRKIGTPRPLFATADSE